MRRLLAIAAFLVLAPPASAGFAEGFGSPIGVGTHPWWVTSGDFNGDGLPDLAVGNDEPSAPAGTVSILLGQIGGSFLAEAPVTVGGRPDSVVAIDLDGDAVRDDLAVANYLSSTVSVLTRNASNTGFDEEGSPVPVGTSPHAVAAGDVNGDGRVDLVTASHALSTVTVLLRSADNTGYVEEAGSPIAVGANPTQIAIADFDGDPDGRLDIATANLGSDDVTVLLRNASNVGFTAEAGTPPAVGDQPVGIAAADFNADALPDLAVASAGAGAVTVLLRRAAGGFEAAPGSPHPVGAGAYGIVTGNLDGDARPDLAVTGHADNSVSVLHGAANGNFDEAAFSRLPTAKGPLVPAAADFDADGRDDLAIPNLGAHTVTVRLNRADPAAPGLAAAPDGCSPPSAGRVALWRGEDGPGDSAGSHVGSLENGGGYRDGVIGRAFSLAGSDDYLHVPGRADLDITGDLSFDAWIRLDDTDFGAPDPYGVGGDRVIVAKANAADTELTYAFWVEGDSPQTAAAAPLAFASGARGNPATVAMSSDLSWQADTWYHVAVVRSGSTVTFYRDGQAAGSATIGGTPASTGTAPVTVGAGLVDATMLNPIKGGLDEAQLFDRALSAAEVAQVHATVTGACFEPETSLTATPPALTNDSTPTFEFSSPSAGATFECRLDGGAFAPCASPHTTAPLADAKHTFAVRAVATTPRPGGRTPARAADPEPAEFEFEVDTAPPETTITSGPDEGAEVTGKPVFAFEASAPDAAFRCYRTSSPGTIIEQTRFFDCGSPTELDLAAGDWRFGVWAIDPAGNADPTPAERNFRMLPPPPVNTVRPEITAVRIQPSTYRCQPGTWTGRDESIPHGFAWQRLTRDDRYPGGYAIQTVAYGQTYRAASEVPPATRSWLFRCVVEAYNAGGTGTELSPTKTLDPTYDPVLENPPFGNIRVRGIDVFQTVQPSAQAATWRWASSPPFNVSCGGGTPTSFVNSSGTCIPGPQDQQMVPYDGVILDRDKAAYALVYADIEGRYAPDIDQRFELRLTRVVQGAERETISQQIQLLPRSDTPYVTAAERGGPSFARRIAIPASWLVDEGGRLDLRAEIRFVRGFTYVNWRECERGVDCSGDNTFTLYGLNVETVPRVKVASVDLADQRQDAWDPNVVLRRAKQLFPGGEGIHAFRTGANVKISHILARQLYMPECAPWKDKGDLKGCIMAGISAVLTDWEARNRTKTANGRTIPLADVVMGLHPEDVAGNWAIGDTGTLEAPDAFWYPTFTANTVDTHPTGNTGRYITSNAHELGHAIGMPHAGKNLSADKNKTDADMSCGGDVGGQDGEFWGPDNSGRLQGMMFDLAPGAGAPRIVTDDPATPLYDLMSYCGDQSNWPQSFERDHWISARNWDRVLRTLQAYHRRRAQAARASGVVARAAQTGSAGTGYVVGTIGPDGARIDRVVPADGSFRPPPGDPDSTVRVRALNASGAAIADSGATVQRLTDHDGTTATFVARVPAGAAAVELARDGRVLDRRVRTQAPILKLLAPRRTLRVRRGGRLVVRWSATDPDGEALRAAVDYSADGGRSWTTLHSGDDSGLAVLAGHTLAASRRARVRVRVTDGFNEPAVASRPFRVDGSPPAPRIERPRRGETVPEGSRVVLRGSAIDDRRLPLAGRRLTWFAGRRPLGRGERLAVRLAPGRHVLRLVATDRLGRRATARTAVRVAAARLSITRLDYEARIAPDARRFTATISASAPATLRLRGRSFKVGTRARRITVTLPARPITGVVRLPVSLSARGRGRVTGVIGLVRR